MKIAYRDVNRHSCILIACFIDEFTRGEHPVIMQLFVSFCCHFVSNFYFTVKK